MQESLSSIALAPVRHRTPTDVFFRIVLLAAAYYALAQLGLLIPTVGPIVSLIWLPAGVALVAVARGGARYWPGIAVGAFAANLNLCGPPVAALIAAGVTLAAFGAAAILRFRGFHRDFRSARDLFSLILAAAAGAAIAAAIGTTSLASFGALHSQPVGYVLLNWWLGDLGGVMILAPALFAFSRADVRKLIRNRHAAGLLGSFALFFATCLAITSGIIPSGRWTVPGVFVLFLIIARTAGHYRVWPASLQIAILAACVVWNNYTLSGPGVFLESHIRIYAAWAFLVSASVVVLGISGLLSERDAIERRLKTGEATYRALVHDNPALFGRFTADGDLLFANETFRRSFAIPAVGDSFSPARADHRARNGILNFFELTGLNRDPKALVELRECDAPERPVCFETQQSHGPSAGRWYRWTARAVDIASTVVVEFHAVGVDVTDQKRAEAERKAVEAQAIQAQQYEAIGVLAGGIAHEFNNILTGLIGNADLGLMVLPPTNEARPMLGEILRGAQRAAELTKQLSIYAGQTDTYPRSQSIADLVNSCERLIEVVVPKHCSLRRDTGDPRLRAIVDETKIRHLLLSLIANAAESLTDRGKAGEIQIRASQRAVDAKSSLQNWTNGIAILPGDYVQLDVADTGCGMTAETLARVFEPFFTTKFQGRGLGMAAVLGIVQDHAGAIRVTSEPDRGTTVSVLLPAGGASVDAPTPLPRAVRRSVRIANASLTR